jgi:anaerobic selenocysteine-containing dehydrogenase
MNPTANLGEWMAWALMVVTDSFDRPGGMWFNPGVFARFDRFDTLPSSGPTEPSPPTRPDVARCGGEWPASLIADEIASGRLRALIVVGGNLVTAIPDTDRLAAALATIDVLVVVDVVHNGTTEFATHLFATAGQLERPDIISLETTAAFRYQHYTDPVVEAPRERPPLWRTVARIGEGIGVDVLANRHGVLDPESATPDEVFAMMVRGDGVRELRGAGGLRVEGGPIHDWVRERLPHGHWNLAPDRLVGQIAGVELEPGDAAGLVLTPRRLVRRMNWQRFREGETNEALVHPSDAHRFGLADGDLAEIRTETGSIRVPVRVTDSIVAGSVSVAHGFEGSNVNTIIDRNAIDPLSGMTTLSAVPVTLTRC